MKTYKKFLDEAGPKDIRKTKIGDLHKLIGDPKAEKALIQVIKDEKKRLVRFADIPILLKMVKTEIAKFENLLRMVQDKK
jgi:hypothetical protein